MYVVIAVECSLHRYSTLRMQPDSSVSECQLLSIEEGAPAPSELSVNRHVRNAVLGSECTKKPFASISSAEGIEMCDGKVYSATFRSIASSLKEDGETDVHLTEGTARDERTSFRSHMS